MWAGRRRMVGVTGVFSRYGSSMRLVGTVIPTFSRLPNAEEEDEEDRTFGFGACAS